MLSSKSSSARRVLSRSTQTIDRFSARPAFLVKRKLAVMSAPPAAQRESGSCCVGVPLVSRAIRWMSDRPVVAEAVSPPLDTFSASPETDCCVYQPSTNRASSSIVTAVSCGFSSRSLSLVAKTVRVTSPFFRSTTA